MIFEYEENIVMMLNRVNKFEIIKNCNLYLIICDLQRNTLILFFHYYHRVLVMTINGFSALR